MADQMASEAENESSFHSSNENDNSAPDFAILYKSNFQNYNLSFKKRSKILNF